MLATSRYRLVPFFTIGKDDAKAEEVHRQMFDLLKDKSIDQSAKLSFYESLLMMLNKFKNDRTPPHIEDPPAALALPTPQKKGKKVKKGLILSVSLKLYT